MSDFTRVSFGEGGSRPDPQACGGLGFKLANSTQYDLVLLEAQSGLVKMNKTHDEKWLGTQTLSFEAYLISLDPNATQAKPLPLSVKLVVKRPPAPQSSNFWHGLVR